MQYSQNFKIKFLKYFKGGEYEQLLENGSPWIGRYIDDTLHSLTVNFSHERFVQLYEEGNLDSLRSIYLESKEIVELKELNAEWRILMATQTSKEEMGE